MKGIGVIILAVFISLWCEEVLCAQEKKRVRDFQTECSEKNEKQKRSSKTFQHVRWYVIATCLFVVFLFQGLA